MKKTSTIKTKVLKNEALKLVKYNVGNFFRRVSKGKGK